MAKIIKMTCKLCKEYSEECEVTDEQYEELLHYQCSFPRRKSIAEIAPNMPIWMREYYISGECFCPKCWKEFFGEGEEDED